MDFLGGGVVMLLCAGGEGTLGRGLVLGWGREERFGGRGCRRSTDISLEDNCQVKMSNARVMSVSIS